MKRIAAFLSLAVLVTLTSAWLGLRSGRQKWSADERTILASLSLASLGAPPKDPSNRYADDTAAARFGKKLFFDARLSSNGKVSCGTCHLPAQDFQDGVALAKGVGTTARRTMPIAGTAHSPFLFWDGRADSHWSQALGPLESPVEHGGNRVQYAKHIATEYRKEYEQVFGKLPAGAHREDATHVYVNMGKAIAAFERTIDFSETRFDRYVAVELAGTPHSAADSLTADEVAGLKLFIGKGSCINCHNGPRLTDDHFHNTGVAPSPLVAEVDSGRAVGVRQALAGEFNCLSKHSDAKPEQCSELRFAVTEGDELLRAYKTPSLRNVAERAPFMHAGQLATLSDVIAHYDRAPRAPFGKSELKRLRLSATERKQLEAFLRTLSAPAVIRGEKAGGVMSFGPIESHDGRFRGEVVEYSPVSQVGSARWVVRLETRSNRRVANAQVEFNAFMPEDSTVRARRGMARYIGNGRYEIAGLQFNRAGWWNVGMIVHHRGKADSLAFNLRASRVEASTPGAW